MRNRSVLAMLVFSILLGLTPLAADPVIRRGVDVFTTPADGRTFYDFAQTPIPAGFFCKGSKAFNGRVAFKGLPLTTRIPGELKGADTIVERLDDAAFDAHGVAVTRLQFRALSMVSINPIKTACGAFHVYVTLGDKQRVTTMRISLTQEGGGTFAAPLAVDARISFIPVKAMKNNSARKLELAGNFTFPANPIPWRLGEHLKLKSISSVVVDTNGDLTPDTQLPGTSNFLAGLSADPVLKQNGQLQCPCGVTCHEAEGHEHCYWPAGCALTECPEG